MRLREFGLELREEAPDAVVAFRNETRCVSALYERSFPDFRTESTWKVLVECVPFLEHSAAPTDRLGVATIPVVLRWPDYRDATPRRKKELALELLQKGVLEVSGAWKWQPEPFLEAYEKVKSLDFVNRGIWNKPKWSPDRKHRASIEFEYELDRFTITMVVVDRRNQEVVRRELVTEVPNEFIFDRHLGELRWLSPFEVTLIPKSGSTPAAVTIG